MLNLKGRNPCIVVDGHLGYSIPLEVVQKHDPDSEFCFALREANTRCTCIRDKYALEIRDAIELALRDVAHEVARACVGVIEKEAEGHIKGSYPQSALLVTAKHLKYLFPTAFKESE